MPWSRGEPAIHYQLSGLPDGPPLVLVRGLGRSMQYWGKLRALLEAELPLVLLDNRGVGGSVPPGGLRRPFTTGDMADDIARVLDHAGIERAHLFGMSLGGMIAQRFALDHPSRLERLVLGCTTPGGAAAERIGAAAVLELLASGLPPADTAPERQARLLLSEAFVRTRPPVIAEWAALARDQPLPRATLALQLLAAARHDAARELARVRAPTLVIGASLDRLVPPDNSRVLARLVPRAELVWLPAGHDFVAERPEETARVLIDFLKA